MSEQDLLLASRQSNDGMTPMTNSIDFSIDARRVLAAAELVVGDHTLANRWFNEPLQVFNHRTPADMVQMGQCQDVIDYLNSISCGYVG